MSSLTVIAGALLDTSREMQNCFAPSINLPLNFLENTGLMYTCDQDDH